jgi:hypothetical protein
MVSILIMGNVFSVMIQGDLESKVAKDVITTLVNLSVLNVKMDMDWIQMEIVFPVKIQPKEMKIVLNVIIKHLI